MSVSDFNNFLHFLVHLIDVSNQKHCTACQIINKLLLERNKQVCVILEEGTYTCRFKKKRKSRPTNPNFEDHEIGNTYIFFWPNPKDISYQNTIFKYIYSKVINIFVYNIMFHFNFSLVQT